MRSLFQYIDNSTNKFKNGDWIAPVIEEIATIGGIITADIMFEKVRGFNPAKAPHISCRCCGEVPESTPFVGKAKRHFAPANPILRAWHEASKNVATEILKSNALRRRPNLKGGLLPRLGGTKKAKIAAPPPPIDPTTLMVKPPNGFVPDYIVEFDGGVRACPPPKHIGHGYGSFKIGCHAKVSLHLGYGHNSSTGEIATLAAALKSLASFVNSVGGNCSDLKVLCRGDSNEALFWLIGQKLLAKNAPAKLREVVEDLRLHVGKFKKVRGEWRSRKHSVALFGH